MLPTLKDGAFVGVSGQKMNALYRLAPMSGHPADVTGLLLMLDQGFHHFLAIQKQPMWTILLCLPAFLTVFGLIKSHR
jgi:hypothetical protein